MGYDLAVIQLNQMFYFWVKDLPPISIKLINTSITWFPNSIWCHDEEKKRNSPYLCISQEKLILQTNVQLKIKKQFRLSFKWNGHRSCHDLIFFPIFQTITDVFVFDHGETTALNKHFHVYNLLHAQKMQKSSEREQPCCRQWQPTNIYNFILFLLF